MLDRLASLQVFGRVATLGSFSAAARDLRLSQSMVTKHVAALEARLGVRLFHRTTRKVTITDAGRVYLEAATRALGDLEAAEAALSAERVEARGLLRVNAPVSFGARWVAPLLPDFARLHPRVVIELGLNDRYVDLAEEGWDLAIRIGHMPDSSLVARRLAVCRAAVCASPAYLRAHGAPRTIADLAAHNCLGYTLARQTGAGVWAFGARGEATVKVSGNLRANNGDALRAAAIAGQGVIYQPSFFVAEDLRDGALVALDLDQPPMDIGGIHAVYLPDHSPTAKVRVFIDFLVARFTPRPPWEAADDQASTSKFRAKSSGGSPAQR
jgi:DNA-binding transcriptional LysR family regulator